MELSLDPRTPVTVITGWLGAGKTTLLNQLLEQPDGQRFAVLINEFGEIGIDQRLVKRTEEDLIELSNGCVCCTVRGDLVQALHRIRRRGPWARLRRKPRFDRVLIETTGIAEPAPILRTFLVENDVATYYQPGTVATMVDARNLDAALQERAGREQIGVADLLLVNKQDLIDSERRTAVEAKVRELNPAAAVVETTQAQVEAARVFASGDAHAWALEGAGDGHSHAHDHGEMGSVTLVEDRPLDQLQVQLWLGACVRLLGTRLVRYKGFMNIRDEDRRIVLQGVYDLFTADAGDPWGAGPRRTELVFIGHGLERDFFERGLQACLAQ